MTRHRFGSLADVIDDLHALFDTWAAGDAGAQVLDEDGMYVLRLAVHEWIANLVQHAYFPGSTEIVLTTEVRGDGLRCTVEDASAGFDFAGQIDAQAALLDAPAPSERGRGLLMLITCTDDLSFTPAGAGQRQTIAFTVRSGLGGAVLAPLFRPEDLADDFALTGPPDDAPLPPPSGPSRGTGSPAGPHAALPARS